MPDVRSVMDEAVYDVLKADSTLNVFGIYNGAILNFDEEPKGQGGHEFPVIVFDLLDSPIESTFGSRGFLCEYGVKCVSRSRYPKEAADVSTLIDTVMEDAVPTPTGFTVLWSVRDTNISFPENSQGIDYMHIGGVWQMWVVAS